MSIKLVDTVSYRSPTDSIVSPLYHHYW